MIQRFDSGDTAVLTAPRFRDLDLDLDRAPALRRDVPIPRIGLARPAAARPMAETWISTPPLAAAAIRQVLLHVTPDHHPGQQVAVGVDVAARFAARLVAVYPMGRPAPLRALLGLARSGGPIPDERAHAAARAAAARVRRLAEDAGVDLDWHLADGEAGAVMGAVGRFHDLVVVPKGDPRLDGLGADVPRRATLRSGRPVLVVPPRAASAEVGRRVFVHWNGSRESALAVRAALPFLATADDVTVLATPDLLADDIEAVPGFGLRAFLRRHGIAAEVRTFEPEGASPAEALLEAAEGAGCDLLVSGAYGAWPVHAWRFGGFTRALLGQTRTPLLLCH